MSDIAYRAVRQLLEPTEDYFRRWLEFSDIILSGDEYFDTFAEFERLARSLQSGCQTRCSSCGHSQAAGIESPLDGMIRLSGGFGGVEMIAWFHRLRGHKQYVTHLWIVPAVKCSCGREWTL